jgi:iron complex transport system ATP-binding protein
MPKLYAQGLSVAYDDTEVIHELSLELAEGRITAIVGANASGKSTLLRAMARLLRVSAGTVFLDGADIHRLPTRQVAIKVGILPQSPIAPDGLVVEDLVARGRYPHQGWLRQWSAEDEEAVEGALAATRMTELAGRAVDSLSGGQRQRAWIAMALAQQSQILLLDEPTTYLDIAHQCEVLDLLADLNRLAGRTVVLVLHDINQACRYAHHIVALREGIIVSSGTPEFVVTESMMKKVFDLDCVIIPDPVSGTPLSVPATRRHATSPLPMMEIKNSWE